MTKLRTADCPNCHQTVEVEFDGVGREHFYVRHRAPNERICSGSYVRVKSRINEEEKSE